MLLRVPRALPASRSTRRDLDVAYWASFAVAAVVFALDATTTIHVIAVRPEAVEMNPIARWTLGSHALAPYLLKGLVLLVCATVAATLRALGERTAARAVIALMAAFGLVGIATSLGVLAA
jgi:hypothetical protein